MPGLRQAVDGAPRTLWHVQILLGLPEVPRAQRRQEGRSLRPFKVVAAMRSVAALAIVLLTLSCGGNSGHSPSPAASAGATANPSASTSGSQAVASYGLLLTA